MTISLEQLADGSVSDRNFQKLMGLVVDTGGLSVGIRFGTNTATWTAAVNSAVANFTHGLGKTPIYVGVTSRNALIGYAVTARDATNLNVTGFVTYNANFTGTLTFDWFVVG